MKLIRFKGSGLIIMVLLGSFLLPSCDLFKPAQDSGEDKVYKDDMEEIQGKRVFNPETGEWEIVHEVTTKIDTVEWVDLPPNKFPPITSDGAYTDIPSTTDGGSGEGGSVLKGSYDVTYLLPFNAQYGEDKEVDRRSSWAVQFYAGVKMALDVLRQEGLNLRVEVLDTRGDDNVVNNLLATNTAVQSADVIIGPYRRSNVMKVAEWAKSRDKVVVSPFQAAAITRDNPNYLQVNPSIQSHCRAIMEHVLKNHAPQEVIILARDTPDERMLVKLLQDTKTALTPSFDETPLMEFLVTDESADFNEMEIEPLIRQGTNTVFVMPSYKSEPFVYNVLRKLAIAKRPGDRLTVYGLPPWKKFERVDFDYYENLNVHLSSATYLDGYDPEIRQFNQRFFDRYATPPEEEAMIGYDLTLYTGRMLQKYGNKFQYSLEQVTPQAYLHGKFFFEREVIAPTGRDDEMDKIDYFENKFVHILKFDDYYFQPADN